MEVRTLLLTLFWGSVFFLGSVFASDTPIEFKRVVANNEELAYVEGGRGDPIVFVHGELQDYRVWARQLEFFAEDYRVIAYSRRNHYPNAMDKAGLPDIASDVHAEDLAAFITALKLPPVHVVAHSSGAHIALFFAAAHPELVRTLSLNEPPAVGLLRTSPLGLEMRNALENQLAPSHEAFRKGELLAGVQLYMDGIGGAGSYKDLSEEMQRAMLDNSASHVADIQLNGPPPMLSCEQVQRVAAPTLLISGSRSQPMFKRINEELLQCLPLAEEVKISAKHDAPLDNPRAFDKAVRAFLKAHRN